ncbi:TetR family transcriptional regulator [Micrococcales bacterium 31B]|nr:TetR family transcriptional regulator [Micrococcales bacterium 31B]
MADTALEPTGHRERIKAQRRHDIECAALRLFAEKGFEATTIADVARDAGVSARTVTMYFPTKAALYTDREEACIGRMLETFRDRDPNASLFDVFEAWLEREQQFNDPEVQDLRLRAIQANPTLRAFDSPSREAVNDYARELIAQELGCAPDHPAAYIALTGCTGIMEQSDMLLATFEPAYVLHLIGQFMRGAAEGLRRALDAPQ